MENSKRTIIVSKRQVIGFKDICQFRYIAIPDFEPKESTIVLLINNYITNNKILLQNIVSILNYIRCRNTTLPNPKSAQNTSKFFPLCI